MRHRKKFVPTHQYRYLLRDLMRVNRSAAKTNIYATNFTVEHCLLCGQRTIDFTNFLPINQTKCVMIPGKCCLSCDSFFEENSDKLLNIPQDIVENAGYHISFEYMVPNYMQHQKCFDKLKSSVIMLCLKSKQHENYLTIIITENEEDASPDQHIYHYRHPIARKALTDLVYNDAVFELLGQTYTPLIVKYASNLTSFHRITEIKLSSGGGLWDGDKNIEMVDALLFSPFTKQLEIIQTSFNSVTQEYYVDVRIFRSFIYKYGNPGVPILSYESTHSPTQDNFGYMNEESLLHAYGYNVSQDCNYSADFRQKLLGEVIDLQLMKPINIIGLLEHNIKMHTNHKYYLARMKWAADIEFVKNYKVNPTRFIIAGIIKP